jgi:hypothetical protein
MPGLKNQDPYLQYRFGLALAAARAKAAGDITFSDDSAFGENLTVVARSKEDQETLAMALALYGHDNSKQMISTEKSQEPPDTQKSSPIVQNSGKRSARKT